MFKLLTLQGQKGKAVSSKLGKIAKITGALLLCSILIAIPTTKLTLHSSMDLAASLYHAYSKLVHVTSPSQTILDDEGIPIVDFGYKGQANIGEQRTPLSVAGGAISHYDNFKESGNVIYKTYFENCINWLENSKIDAGGCYLWACNFPNPGYLSSPPWYSALAQVHIMLALERAYELSGDERYLELANKAMFSLDTPIEEGGVMYQDQNSDGKWYAEVVSPERDKPPFILNGHMEVLLHLRDYYDRTGNELALTLFQEGVAELKPHLQDYDTGHWTYYDREGNLAYDYHYVHIDETQYLYEVTGDEIFKEYHDKWSSYFPLNPMWARRRFAAYLLNITIVFLTSSALVGMWFIVRRLMSKRKTLSQ